MAVQPMAEYGKGIGGSAGLMEAMMLIAKANAKKNTPDDYTQAVDFENAKLNQEAGISFDDNEDGFMSFLNDYVDINDIKNMFTSSPQQMQSQNLGFNNMNTYRY